MKNFNELKEQSKKSLKLISEETKIPMSTLNSYLSNTKKANETNLIKIAKYFNVSLDYLCEHKINNELNYGNIDNEHIIAHNILQALPEQQFYEYLGRLKTTADILGINY